MGGLRLRVVHHLEDYFPRNAQTYAHLDTLWQLFGRDDAFLLVALEHHSYIGDSVFLRKLKDLTFRVRDLPHVHASYSITTLYKFIPAGTGWLTRPLANERTGWIDSAYIQKHDLYRWFVSTNWKATLLVIHTQWDTITLADHQLPHLLEHLLQSYHFKDYYVLGKAWTEYHFIRTTVRELILYASLGLLVLVLLVYLLFRQKRLVAIALWTLAATLLWSAGWLGWVSPELPAVSPMLFDIVLIAAVGDLVHLSYRYMRLLFHYSPQEAMQQALREVGAGILLTSLTTAMGFMALLASPTPVIQWLGLHTAIGVLLAYVIIWLGAVPLLLLFPPSYQEGPLYRLLRKFLQILTLWIRRHPTKIATTTLLFIFLIGLGSFRLTTDARLLDDVTPSHPARRGFEFIDRHFQIGRFQEFLVHSSHKPFTQTDSWLPLLRTDSLLRTLWQPRAISAAPEVLYLLQVARPYQLDTLAWQLRRRHVLRFLHQGFWRVVDSSFHWARFRIMIPDRGSRHNYQLVQQTLKAFGQDSLLHELRLIPTGFIYAFDFNNIYLANSLWKSILVVVAATVAMFWLLLRRLSLLIVFLIVNVLPLIALAGLMGWLGISLRATTAMLFTIAFGIAVDDTTHFMAVYGLQRRKRPTRTALWETYRHTGMAMLITSVLLVSVLALLATSSFLATRYVGIFLGTTLIVATWLDLTLAPILLHWLTNREQNGTLFRKNKRSEQGL